MNTMNSQENFQELDVGEGDCISRRSLLVTPTLYCIGRGPTGEAEALCFLDSSAASRGFWYGYVCRHPKRDCFVSIIVFTTAFVDAFESSVLFDRFDYWVRKRLKYDPCIADGFSEVYRENSDFESAVQALRQMVAGRQPSNGFGGPDMRIVDVFGMTDFKDRDGVYPSCP